MPGHRGGAGAPRRGVEALGAEAYAADVSELGGFDYLHQPRAGLLEAQARAAEVFGADRSWFLVNGATVGNLAALVATAPEGATVLAARSSHRSVYAGLVLAGAEPVWLEPARSPHLDVMPGPAIDTVARAIREAPALAAVHVTSPSHFGYTLPIDDIADLAHARGVPLIVDEAHGSHFSFHEELPVPALHAGADLVVHSPHKTLGSLTQSALLHASGELVDASAVSFALQVLQSSSPSSLLLASLDAAIGAAVESGRSAWDATLRLAEKVRLALGRVPAVVVHGREMCKSPGIADIDLTKIVIDVSGTALTGVAAAAILRREWGINPEAADLRRMVFSLTPGDDADSAALLVEAVEGLVRGSSNRPGARAGARAGAVSRPLERWPLPRVALSPRQAAQVGNEPVPLEESVGRIAAEMVVPYPPGVPLLAPGEVVTEEVVSAIRRLAAEGARIVGTDDPACSAVRCLGDTAVTGSEAASTTGLTSTDRRIP